MQILPEPRSTAAISEETPPPNGSIDLTSSLLQMLNPAIGARHFTLNVSIFGSIATKVHDAT